jgi:hypothetical protein
MKRSTWFALILLYIAGILVAVFAWLGRREKVVPPEPETMCYQKMRIEPAQPESPDRATKQDALLRQLRDAGRISQAVMDKRLGSGHSS